MSQSKKEIQVQESIQQLAGQFLAREASPQSLITVTRAHVDSALKYCTIYISVMPVTAEKGALDFCKRSRSDFRDFMKKKSALHFPPLIDFELDYG